jgi:hypothetical protein
VCFEQLARYFGNVKQKSDYLNRNELEQLAMNGGLRRSLIMPWWKKVRKDVVTIKHQSIHVTEGPELDAGETLKIIQCLVEGVKAAHHRHDQ